MTVPAGTKPPAKPGKPVVIANGKGKPIEKGSQLVGRYVVYDYTGKKQASTWDGQPAPRRRRPSRLPRPTSSRSARARTARPARWTACAGVPIGSRVLVELPPPRTTRAR